MYSIPRPPKKKKTKKVFNTNPEAHVHLFTVGLSALLTPVACTYPIENHAHGESLKEK